MCARPPFLPHPRTPTACTSARARAQQSPYINAQGSKSKGRGETSEGRVSEGVRGEGGSPIVDREGSPALPPA